MLQLQVGEDEVKLTHWNPQLDFVSGSTSVPLLSRNIPLHSKPTGFNSLEHREGEGADPLGLPAHCSTSLS